MDIDAIREYCLNKPGKVREDMPFGDGVLVFRIEGKIFLLMRLETRPLSVNLKCDPAHALELREQYESVQPGYHMNKKHWNTVILDGKIPTKEVFAMIDHSYDQIAGGAKRKGTNRQRKIRKKR